MHYYVEIEKKLLRFGFLTYTQREKVSESSQFRGR